MGLLQLVPLPMFVMPLVIYREKSRLWISKNKRFFGKYRPITKLSIQLMGLELKIKAMALVSLFLGEEMDVFPFGIQGKRRQQSLYSLLNHKSSLIVGQ